MKVEVCILAGGRSSRMGRPKQALKLDGAPLVDWSRRIAIGAGLQYRVIDRDLAESRGPVSGIETALATTGADAVIFLSCDMPFVRSATLRELVKILAQHNGAFCRSGRFAGFPFALRRSAQIRGESLQAVAKALKAEFVELDSEEAFNINTPADFEEAQRRLTDFCARTILDVDALSIRRNDVEILKNLNWRVLKGEHWAILGANGSGKTSLLSVLTGYFSATSGRVRLLGKELDRADWRALRTHIGIVSSSLRQMMADGETALETVASGKDAMIDVWGPLKRADAERARGILRDVGCAYLERRVWAALSHGERQRVLIGRALMADPALLILDEPCAGLDPAARENFLEFVQSLIEKPTGPAVIFVTHHIEEIATGITHVLALRAGEIAAMGPKKKILNDKLLSEIFECRARVTRDGARYGLKVLSHAPRAI